MRLVNQNKDSFEFRINSCVILPKDVKVNWWFNSKIVITENGRKRTTHLKLLTWEDLERLSIWLKKVYAGNFEQTIFQFVDGHVWFRLWKKGNERIIRFFIKGDKYRKFYWDWRFSKDKEGEFLKYTEALKYVAKQL